MASILQILTLVNLLTGLMAITRPKLGNFPLFSLQLIDAWLRLSLYSSIGYFVIGAFAYLLYRRVKEAKSSTKINIPQIDFDKFLDDMERVDRLWQEYLNMDDEEVLLLI